MKSFVVMWEHQCMTDESFKVWFTSYDSATRFAIAKANEDDNVINIVIAQVKAKVGRDPHIVKVED